MNSTVSAGPWRNAPATGYHQDLWTLSSRVYAWAYLFKGPSIIQAGFDRSKGKPFEVFAPDNRYVFVTTQAQIKELDSAPDTMLQPVYTMHGFNWFDRRGTEGVGFIRALRTLLVNNLPDILPSLGPMIRARFEELHLGHTQVGGRRQSPVYPMIVNIVVLTNAVSFFGGSIARNEKFMRSALAYVEETLISAEVIRLLPKMFQPFIKESARLTPVESMSTRRSALQPFEFADGTKLAIGDWACTPVRAIMTDATNYPAPLDFKGFRPGRFYASAVMKAILGQIIMHYDCELAQPDADRWFTWRSTMLPKHDTMVIFTPR
ncbi:hypothetical protein DL767_011140 [Monosporascus sp. MG133]|nr:hypothetical protein DL767_011140 [Monosporascus sp. MG133]